MSCPSWSFVSGMSWAFNLTFLKWYWHYPAQGRFKTIWLKTDTGKSLQASRMLSNQITNCNQNNQINDSQIPESNFMTIKLAVYLFETLTDEILLTREDKYSYLEIRAPVCTLHRCTKVHRCTKRNSSQCSSSTSIVISTSQMQLRADLQPQKPHKCVCPNYLHQHLLS